jgi:hypothetical protein
MYPMTPSLAKARQEMLLKDACFEPELKPVRAARSTFRGRLLVRLGEGLISAGETLRALPEIKLSAAGKASA